jgi:hypothetical protein
MKQKLYIFGLITSLIIITGIIFKINHWPGAGWLLTFGLTFLAVFFIPAALVNNYRSQHAERNLLLYIVTGVTCLVLFIAMLFKVQHWPGAGLALSIALPFPYVVFLPVFLVITSRNKNFNIYNTIFVLLLLALSSVFSALLALNVSKTRIDDSLNLTRNYIRLDNVLANVPEKPEQNQVTIKIDSAIKTINEYRNLILQQEGISREQWSNNPSVLWRPDAMNVAAIPLMDSNESYPGERLESDLKSLLSELEKDPSYKKLVESAPVIFDYTPSAEEKYLWGERIFIFNNLSWALTYLEGLEVNLNLIKTSSVISQ